MSFAQDAVKRFGGAMDDVLPNSAVMSSMDTLMNKIKMAPKPSNEVLGSIDKRGIPLAHKLAEYARKMQ